MLNVSKYIMGCVTMKASCKKIKGFVKEERMASKEYASYGFMKQSRDEAGHNKYFAGLYKKKCRK